MIEQCKKCKHKEILNGGIVWCFYMGADCRKGEMFDPITNGDRIRAMNDEELAEWIVKKTVYQESAWSTPSHLNLLTNSDDTLESAIKGTSEWLKQPAE